MKWLIYFSLLISTGTLCHGRTNFHKLTTSPIYINTPDSSVKAYTLNAGTSTKTREGRIYYWYGNNSIHSTENGFSGRLLHGKYTSFYPDHNLRSQGEFDHGVKTSTWKTWYSTGAIHETFHYSRGKLDGAYEVYDPSGKLLLRIYYRNGARHGKTTFFSQEKSDSVIRYKKGHIVPPKKQPSDSSNKKTLIKKEKKNQDSVTVGKRKMKKDSLNPKNKKAKNADSTKRKGASQKEKKTKKKLRDIFRWKTKEKKLPE
ncbi:MAG TPA: hypothetical protein VK826_14075 [Bacteroidia bacterium]|nr:hypothetical protein [Bacteroidia bacterium]